MLLIDYSAVSIASLAANMISERKKKIELDYGYHIVLNSILHYIRSFNGRFGETSICCDSWKSWRKEVFPYYKAARKQKREEGASPFDWNSLFAVANNLKTVLKESFPVELFECEGYEADDLIAAFTEHTSQPVIICSEDKDFYQLLDKRSDVYIYHNKRKEFFVSHDILFPDLFEWVKESFSKCTVTRVDKDFARNYLIEQIIRGDASDGVPNMLSDDDVFVNPEKRQRAITKKVLQELVPLLDNGTINNHESQEIRTNYDRNSKLISLSGPSSELLDFVVGYMKTDRKNVSALDTQKWLVNNGLMNLANRVNDFFPTLKTW